MEWLYIIVQHYNNIMRCGSYIHVYIDLRAI